MFTMENLLHIPDRSRSLSFPLPEGALPPVQLTPDDESEYRATSATIIERTLEMEHEYRANKLGSIAAGNWKVAKEKEGFCVYKRMAKASDGSSQALQPMVLCVGTMSGKIEEVLYGLHDSSTDQMRAINSFMTKDTHLDAAVLKVIDKGTAEDPFRLLAIKWRMSWTPGGSLIRNRDTFTLESNGLSVDQYGERYGYVMLKSIERPDFPAFSKKISVRSTIAFCCIFRQVTPNTIAIYGKGIMNLGGEMPDWFCYNYACPRMAAILETTKCQKAKQLTALAIKNGCKFVPSSMAKLGMSRVHASSHDSVFTESTRSRSDSGSSTGSSCSFKLRRESYVDKTADCSLCRKPSTSVLWVRSSRQECQICRRVVCGKCVMKRTLLAAPVNIQAWCCKGCILEAASLPIDARNLCPLLCT